MRRVDHERVGVCWIVLSELSVAQEHSTIKFKSGPWFGFIDQFMGQIYEALPAEGAAS